MTEEMILELMSGLRFRLPFSTLISIDHLGDLLPLLALPEMTYAIDKETQKMELGLNVTGGLTLLQAITMHEKGFVSRLLWKSTRVPDEMRQVRRIEFQPEAILVTSDYADLQGWTYEPVPDYTLRRMLITGAKPKDEKEDV